MTRQGSSPLRLSAQAWFALLALGLALWLSIRYIGLFLEMAGVLFGAILVSLAIRPLADALALRRIPRGVTVIAAYAALIGALVLVGSLLVPFVGTEIAELQSQGPALVQQALSFFRSLPLIGSRLPSADTLAPAVIQRLGGIATAVLGTARQVGSLTLDVLVALILAYFFTVENGWRDRLLSGWVPARYRPKAERIAEGLRYRLTRWAWAQAALALYFGVVFSIGLRLLGVPFALTIGLIGGILEMIPYVGGLVAISMAILSALTVSPLLALWVALFYIVVVEIEAHIAAPAFYGRIIGLHPAIILVALLFGAKAKGVLGVLFAAPVAVVVAAVLQEVRAAVAATDAVAEAKAAESEEAKSRTVPPGKAPE